MCLLPDSLAQSIVRKALDSMLAKSSVFTGYDVALKAREMPEAVGVNLKGSDVSSFVREQFNSKPFPNYAIAKLSDGGPMFYFPLTKGMAATKMMVAVDAATDAEPVKLDIGKFRVGHHHTSDFRAGNMAGWAMTFTPTGKAFFFKMSPAMTAAKYIEQVRSAMSGDSSTQSNAETAQQ